MEAALAKAVGKNAKVAIAHDYFSNRSPAVEGKGFKSACLQVVKKYNKHHPKMAKTFMDENKTKHSTDIIHRSYHYSNVFEYVIKPLHETIGDIKSYMENRVADLREEPSIQVSKFISELEAQVEAKGWRHTFENFKFTSKPKNPVNALNAEQKNTVKEKCARFMTPQRLELE